jgi:hypothetical protein
MNNVLLKQALETIASMTPQQIVDSMIEYGIKVDTGSMIEYGNKVETDGIIPPKNKMEFTKDELRQLYYGIEFTVKNLRETDRQAIVETFGKDYFEKTLKNLLALEEKLVTAFYSKDDE